MFEEQPVSTNVETAPQPPRDYLGLPILGMLMQLGAAMSVALHAQIVFLAILIGQGVINSAGRLLALGVAGVVCSIFHWIAGASMVRGRDAPLAALRGYFIASGVHLVLAIYLIDDVPMFGSAMMWPMIGMYALWPVALGSLLFWPRFRKAVSTVHEVPDERGFEGLSVLMVIFSATGVLFWLMIQFIAPDMPMTYRLVGLALMVRSGLHLRAGVNAMRRRDPARFAKEARTYVQGGIVLGIVGTLAAFFELDMRTESLTMMVAPMAMLLAWPLIVWGFLSTRDFPIETESSWSAHAESLRDPDRGVSGLSWMLFGNGAMAAMGFATAGGLERFTGQSANMILTAFTTLLNVGVAIELLRDSHRRRIVLLGYGALGTIAALWTWSAGGFNAGALSGRDMGISALASFGLPMALIVPAVAFYLAWREQSSPTVPPSPTSAFRSTGTTPAV